MQLHASILSLLLLGAVNASVLSTTNLATVLKEVQAPSVLKISAAATTAIGKLGTGGANAKNLSTADGNAINQCTNDARAGNAAAVAGLGGGTGAPGNIAFVVNKVSLHACESAQQQIGLVTKGTASSDATVNLFISNVGVLNVNTKKAGITSKRAVEFEG